METNSLPTAEQNPPKLRWYQWRLRSMFLLTLVVAVGMSYVAVTMRDCRKQNVAAEAIRKAGGEVTLEPTWLGNFARNASLTRVTEVIFHRRPITDTVLVHLQGLSRLRTLWLNNTHITDAGLVNLQGLSQLRTLVLADTQITDAGLVHLQGLKQLQLLRLDGTKVTDQGVKKLQQALPNCAIW